MPDSTREQMRIVDGPAAPGVPKPDPIVVADGVRRSFGGVNAVDVEHVEHVEVSERSGVGTSSLRSPRPPSPQ